MWLTLVLSFLESLIKSRVGQLIVVALISWFWSAHNTATYWRGVIAQEKAQIEAAYKAEVARQEAAAEEIAAAATARAEEDAQAVADMQKVISDYEKKLQGDKHVHANTNCVIDDDFSRIVHELTPPAGGKAPSTPAARRVRKAR